MVEGTFALSCARLALTTLMTSRISPPRAYKVCHTLRPGQEAFSGPPFISRRYRCVTLTRRSLCGTSDQMSTTTQIRCRERSPPLHDARMAEVKASVIKGGSAAVNTVVSLFLQRATETGHCEPRPKLHASLI